MRNFIIGISILFFSLSGFITFKALSIPVNNTRYQNALQLPEPKDVSSKSEDVAGQLAGEQAANRALVEQLQATIAKLKGEISSKNEDTRVNAEAKGFKEKAKILTVLGSGAFRSGQVFINEDLVNAVKEVVPDILASPGYHVIVEGHTDNIPISSSTGKRYRDNMELSFLRAKAVAQILEKNGIPLDSISVIGYGDTRPIESNETDEGRVKNRRVEIKLLPGNKEF